MGPRDPKNFKLLVFKGILLKFSTVHFFNNRNWYHTHFWCFGSFQGKYKNFRIFSISFRSGKTWSNFELLLCFQRSTNGSSNVQNLLRTLQSSLWVIYEVSGWLGCEIRVRRRSKNDSKWAKIWLFWPKRGVYVKIFAPQSLRRALRVPKSYLGPFAEFKNGLKVEIGAEIRILAGREMDRGSISCHITFTGLPEFSILC